MRWADIEKAQGQPDLRPDESEITEFANNRVWLAVQQRLARTLYLAVDRLTYEQDIMKIREIQGRIAILKYILDMEPYLKAGLRNILLMQNTENLTDALDMQAQLSAEGELRAVFAKQQETSENEPGVDGVHREPGPE